MNNGPRIYVCAGLVTSDVTKVMLPKRAGSPRLILFGDADRLSISAAVIEADISDELLSNWSIPRSLMRRCIRSFSDFSEAISFWNFVQYFALHLRVTSAWIHMKIDTRKQQHAYIFYVAIQLRPASESAMAIISSCMCRISFSGTANLLTIITYHAVNKVTNIQKFSNREDSSHFEILMFLQWLDHHGFKIEILMCCNAICLR